MAIGQAPRRSAVGAVVALPAGLPLAACLGGDISARRRRQCAGVACGGAGGHRLR